MAKGSVTYIRAVVDRAVPETNDYKPYRTELTFDGKLFIDVPVPTSEITKEGDKIILTLEGWKAFLKNYTTKIQELTTEYSNSFKR